MTKGLPGNNKPVQSVKYKILPEHTMKERMTQPVKQRLQRGSFLHLSRKHQANHPDLNGQTPKEFPRCLSVPAWKETTPRDIRSSIPGIGPKNSQNEPERRLLALEHIGKEYQTWTTVYTDGSAENAIKMEVLRSIYNILKGRRNELVSQQENTPRTTRRRQWQWRRQQIYYKQILCLHRTL